MRLAAILLLCLVLTADAVTVVVLPLLDEVMEITENDDGTATTNSYINVTFVFEQFGAPYQNTIQVAAPYTVASVSNAVVKASAQLAVAHHVPDWNPQIVMMP